MPTACRVLVIEDETVVRFLCAEILSGEGFAVSTATDPREAVRLLATQPVDVVLSDLFGPAHLALATEVIDTIRSATPAPIILVTARYEALAATAAGAAAVILKPFDVDHLIATVRAVLGG